MECGLGSPYVDWFHVNRDHLATGRPLGAYPDESLKLAVAGNEWAELHRSGMESFQTLGYRAWWDLPALPKLNTDNPKVREYLFGVAEHWIRFGADGWRLDVAAEIDDDEFWREFRRRVKAIDPDAYIVAEIWYEDHRWLQGDQFDAFMNYPLAEAAISFAAGRHLDEHVVGQHTELAANCPPRGRADVRGAARPCPLDVRPRDQRRPAEPPGEPRHAPRPDDVRRRPRRASPRHARPDDRGRRAVHLLRRRDRDGRRAGPVEPGRVPDRRGGLGPRPARVLPRSHRAPPPSSGPPARGVRDRRRCRHGRRLSPLGRPRRVRRRPQRRRRAGPPRPVPAGARRPRRSSRSPGRAGRGQPATASRSATTGSASVDLPARGARVLRAG